MLGMQRTAHWNIDIGIGPKNKRGRGPTHESAPVEPRPSVRTTEVTGGVAVETLRGFSGCKSGRGQGVAIHTC